MSIWNKFKAWEDWETSKSSKRLMIIYDTATKQSVAEMTNSCLFFKPHSTQRFPFALNETQK